MLGLVDGFLNKLSTLIGKLVILLLCFVATVYVGTMADSIKSSCLHVSQLVLVRAFLRT